MKYTPEFQEKLDLLESVAGIKPSHLNGKLVSDYDLQAMRFLDETKTEINIVKIGPGFPPWDEERKETRNVYRVVLKNKNHEYSFDFYDSLANTRYYPPMYGKRHTIAEREKAVRKWEDKERERRVNLIYSILACLNVDYSEDFEDFCDNYGYEKDSIKAFDTYNAVRKETRAIKKLWPSEEEQEKLHDIC